MTPPDLKFYATHIHNLAVAQIVLDDLCAALAAGGTAHPDVLLQACSALDNALYGGRLVLADRFVGEPLRYDATLAAVKEVLSGPEVRQHIPEAALRVAEQMAYIMAAMARVVRTATPAPTPDVHDVDEAKALLDRIAHGK